MGRVKKNSMEKCQSVSLSLPGPYLDAIDRAGSRSRVIQYLIEQNLDSLGCIDMDEVDKVKRELLKASLIPLLKEAMHEALDKVVEEVQEEIRERFRGVEEDDGE